MQKLRQNNQDYQNTDTKKVQAMVRFRSLLVWVLPLFVCIVIFHYSAQSGEESTEMSSPLTVDLVTTYSHVFQLPWNEKEILEYATSIEIYVRKAAHMTEYAILLSTVVFAAWKSLPHRKRLFLFSELFTVLYAASDEFHQWFVPGRSAKVTDVLIDSLGSLIGLLICILVIARRKKRKEFIDFS